MDEKVEKIIDRLRYLIKCDIKNPCDYDHTCVNHQISWKIQRLFSEKDKKIEELEIQLLSRESWAANIMRESEARIKELEEEIKDILGESTISYVVEKRLRELIEKGE